MQRNNAIDLDQARDRLRSGGEPPMTTLEQRVIHLEKDTSEIKHDLKSLRAETTEEFKEVKKDISEIKSDVAVIKNKLHNMENNLASKAEMHSLARQTIMWNVGSTFTAVGIVFALLRYLAINTPT